MLERIAAGVTRRPRRVVAITACLAVVVLAAVAPLASQLKTGQLEWPGSDSQRVAQGATVVALRAAPHVRDVLARDPAVTGARVSGPFTIAFLRRSADPDAAVERLTAALPGVTLGGSAVADRQLNETVSSDLARAELFAFPLLLLLLVLVFRGLVPALLPLLVGVLTVSASALALGVINQLTPTSVFALNLVAGLGLGLSVDYSLLMVVRYREEAAAVGFGAVAVARTVRTAGRTILFSAVTVGVAMGALLVFPLGLIRSMGVGGILVTGFSALLAIVFLPAVLLLAGKRVGAPRAIDHERARGFWFALASASMRRPLMSAGLVIALLVGLSLPVLGVRFSLADASALPSGVSARVVAQAAPPGALSPAFVVGRGEVALGAAPTSDAAVAAVERLRASGAVVGGDTAAYLDVRSGLASRLPWAVAILAGATFLALFVLTGSLLLPLKAVLMNVLSIGASLGLLTLLFGRLELYQPVLIAALAFGLSTDYAVFLLSRIKGFHDRGDDDVSAVAYGLQRTGRLVTAAALLFCVAIGALATSRLGLIQQLGIGAATAVLIDATLIRGVLVPSLMALLGRWNWWAPGPLRGFVAEEHHETAALVR